ncbi:hypothetical protein [Fusibacter sp. 3D3]|uniref:hypothetical protein n=1 Tax=Fusibacter sp. 3D3 TaxID=1048380 RepID=UPI000852E7AA|nr:hypothetical protein [Fusibacter sp. 3D3]GAU78014.1 hypothetical protein F3D3_2643 [Fusibacter sp. 3D3]
MDFSKYMATGNAIKALGLKLQSVIDSEAVNQQEEAVNKGSKKMDRVSDAYINPGIAVAGLLFILVIGTFILLHFW